MRIKGRARNCNAQLLMQLAFESLQRIFGNFHLAAGKLPQSALMFMGGARCKQHLAALVEDGRRRDVQVNCSHISGSIFCIDAHIIVREITRPYRGVVRAAL